MTGAGDGLAGDHWTALETPVAELDISRNAADLLAELGYERLVDLARMQQGADSQTRVRELRDMAVVRLEAFTREFLSERIGAYESLTANIGRIAGARDSDLKRLWDANVTTISTLVTVDPTDHGIAVERWVRGATLLARGAAVPREIDGLFNKEFAPGSMYDVITASPRFLLGIGPTYSRRLRRLGIETVGQLATRTAWDLQRDLGITQVLAGSFSDKAMAAVGVDAATDRVDEALADLKAITERFKMAVEEFDLEPFGREVEVLARDTSLMLDEYLTFLETTQRLRRTA